MVTYPLNNLPQQNTPSRFDVTTLGEFLEKAREAVNLTQEVFAECVNPIIIKLNEHLPKKEKIPTLNKRIYGSLERKERYPAFGELEPIYQTLSELLEEEPFSEAEREQYLALAQTRIGERKKAPKQGRMPTAKDWQNLRTNLAVFDKQKGRSAQRGKTPYLLSVVPPADVPQIRLSAKVKSLLGMKTSSIYERDSYIDQMIQSWEAGKRLVVTKALSGTGKTRAFYLFMKHIASMQDYWPFYYLLKPLSGNQTPDDHLDNLLSLLSADLGLSSPEDTIVTREERTEQIFTELARCSEHGLRLAVLLDDVHLLLDQAGTLPACWQEFFELWIGRKHTALLGLATREWPHWKGRDWKFLKEIELPPLSPEGGAKIWKDFGFGDVPQTLLEKASRKCEGCPHWIEMRASDLDQPEHRYLWPTEEKGTFTSQSTDNEHTARIKAWLLEETIFDARTDFAAREALTQIFSRQLSYEVQQVLDLLTVAPLGIPFQLLEQETHHLAQAIDEMKRCSLVDRSSLAQERVALVSLAREARLHQLSKEQREDLELHVTGIYSSWLKGAQGFKDDGEKAALISEMAGRYIRAGQLLKAAELLIEYGWLCFVFGSASRIARIADETMCTCSWHRSVEDEVGKLLLQHHWLAYTVGKDLGSGERKKAYLYLYEIMTAQGVVFEPGTIVLLVHHKLRYLMQAKQYSEARLLVDEACQRYEDLQHVRPISYADLLDRRAYVLGRWGDHEDALAKKEQDERVAQELRSEAFRHWQQAVLVHQQCIELLHHSERFSSPVEQSHIRFKRARLLNDLSYYRRCIGLLEEAKLALEESLKLKEAGYVSAKSLAVSYGEYAQLLGELGHFQEMLPYSDRALCVIQGVIDDGDASSLEGKGMQLIDKGKLLLLLGHLDEAKALFNEGIPLVEGTSRSVYKDHAEEGLRTIEAWHKANPLHQLDWRWYPRYHLLVSYDDIVWLTQAGPFLEEEQDEWDNLINKREDANVAKRLSAILVQSRKREITACLEEQREPHFHYPLIPHAEVQSKLADLSLLRAEIEQDEPNIIVRRLYLGAIDERLDELKLVDAAYRGDDEHFWVYSQRLAEKTTLPEMQVALAQLLSRIELGHECASTRELSKYLFQKLQQWHLLPLIHTFSDIGWEHQVIMDRDTPSPMANNEQRMFSPHMVQSFFKEIFREYQFAWSIVVDSTATSERVDLNKCRLILPDKPMSSTKIRELLAHEIEAHAFRASSGAKSPLALLSSGLGGYLGTEEGLAVHYAQEAFRQGTGIEPKPKLWIGTLACGLASGAACSPLSFRELFLFIEAVSLLVDLLDGKEFTPQLQEKARRYAENRCLRTYRGVTHLDHIGICSNKDTHYLRGFLKVRQELERDPKIFEQLLVGSVGLHHLADLTKLGIRTPGVVHKHLAINPDLDNYIMQFADGGLS